MTANACDHAFNVPSTLITGGGGMLAAAFKRLLPHATVLSRAEFDITEDGWRLSDFQPKVVINCAAYTQVDQAEREPERAQRVNGHGVARLASACIESAATLVHFSTDYVFDGTLRRPLRPDDPTGPQSVYGQSKLFGETAIRSFYEYEPPRWLIIRTAWLYGPGGPNFPNTMIAAARAGKPLRVIDDQIGSPTYTLDLAAATIALLGANATGIFHFANAGETSWHDFAAEIFRQMRLPANLSRTTSAAWKAERPMSAERPSYSVLDTTAYTAATGRTVRPWREALADYIKAAPAT